MPDDPRLLWLRERHQGLGATDVAAICGVGFRTPQEVYDEKIALEPFDSPPSPLMRMGLMTEAGNAELYAERTGATLHAPGLIRSPVLPWALATMDRVRTDEVAFGRPVECKYTMFFGDLWGAEGTAEIPPGYVVQTTWQMQVLRHQGRLVTQADVSALASTGEHRIYTVEFDHDLADLLVGTARAFWDRVQARAGMDGWTAPFAENDALSILARVVPGSWVSLGPDVQDLVERWELAKGARKAAEDEESALKKHLTEVMAHYQEGTLPDGRRLSRSVVSRKSYTVEATTYTQLRLKAAPRGKRTGI